MLTKGLSPVTTRWMGVGLAPDPVTEGTARDATADAIDGRTPSLVMLFCPVGENLESLVRAVRETAGYDVPLVGCSTAGEIAGTHAGSGGLVVMALGGEGLVVETAVGTLADGARAAGIAAASPLAGIESPHRALILLTEGLTGERSEVVRGAYSVAGASVQLVGGCAADDLAMEQTFQFHDDQVLSGAVVSAAIGSDAPIGVGIGHGWRRIGEPMSVTESDGSIVYRLDDEPALDAYLKRLNAPPEVYTDFAAWQSFAVLHPLGLARPGGEEIRAVLGADHETRALSCSDVPEGTLLWMMEGDTSSVLSGTETACEQVLGALDGHAPRGIVAFDCVARFVVLGEAGLQEEVDTIARLIPDVPVGGFYTYGEIARTQGSRGVHNATLVLLALA